jgi:hypothetical protein
VHEEAGGGGEDAQEGHRATRCEVGLSEASANLVRLGRATGRESYARWLKALRTAA